VNPEPSPNVLKLLDMLENLSVKEFVWFNKLLQERLGISDADLGFGARMAAPAAAAPAAAEAAAPEPPPKEEKTTFDVIIEGFDASAKIKIIKEVRTMVPGLGLKEGKALVCSLVHQPPEYLWILETGTDHCMPQRRTVCGTTRFA
jgi:large subunit ribosomal protein L7/L12